MNTDMSHNTIPATSTNTAVSLWHKFATWQNEMDQCRTLERNMQDEQDQILSQLKELHNVREEEQRKIHEMEQPQVCSNKSAKPSDVSSLEKLNELQRQLDNVEELYRTASASLHATQRTDHTQESIRTEMIRETIEKSNSFAIQCRRIQYQLRQSALDATPDVESAIRDGGNIETSSTILTLHAVLCAAKAEKTGNGTNTNGTDDMWMSKTINDLNDSNILHTTTMLDFDESNDENDPTAWKVSKDNDIELYRAIELHNQQREKHDLVETEMNQLQSKYDTVRNKGLDRDRRMMKLQTQLDRIQNDCTTLQSEMDQCQQLILEDEALAHTYRTKINQRNHQHQTKKSLRRQIGFQHSDRISFEKLPTQKRPPTLASLIPPVVQAVAPSIAGANQNLSQEGHSVQNPYAASRKRSIEANPSTNRPQDLASVVLGRPSQRHHGSAKSASTYENVPMSRKNHRRRIFRDRLEFGCSVAIGTNTSDDIYSYECNESQATSLTGRNQNSPINDCLDGDTAGGAAMDKSSTTRFDLENGNADETAVDYDIPDDDDDLLAFVAFPHP